MLCLKKRRTYSFTQGVCSEVPRRSKEDNRYERSLNMAITTLPPDGSLWFSSENDTVLRQFVGRAEIAFRPFENVLVPHRYLVLLQISQSDSRLENTSQAKYSCGESQPGISDGNDLASPRRVLAISSFAAASCLHPGSPDVPRAANNRRTRNYPGVKANTAFYATLERVDDPDRFLKREFPEESFNYTYGSSKNSIVLAKEDVKKRPFLASFGNKKFLYHFAEKRWENCQE
ncbi:hypothetical protein WN48_04078 [Eufriesea mexicana]|uniref:Uncharacterized protein n=1 Tax=Eufriesea mexicana TaxID=516756 RepID=A0A310SJP5_9HYME|nr:hypothetical protein WN48_04078 [Eufriesea mexicana]